MLSFYDLRRLLLQKLHLLPVPLLLFLLSTFAVIPSSAFTFRFTSAPQQCSDTSAIWQGGTAPFKLLLLPIGFQPQGVERRVIFERTVSSGDELAFIFPFPANTRFVAVMSDATGFGTGGTSPILTVASSNTTTCLPTSPSEPQFYLYISPTTLTQCSSISITWDVPRNPPVTIYGVIPQGQSFDVSRHSNGTSGSGLDWTVDVRSGTPFFFVAGDANGSGTGGSTDVQNVGVGSSGCIRASSPISTPDAGVGSVGPLPGGGSAGESSGTLTGTTTTTTTATDGSGSNGSSGGTGSDNGNGDGSGDSNGSGSGNGNGGGNNNGSGGGTVHGPLDPTSIAGASNNNTYGPNVPIILGIVSSVLGLAVLTILLILYYKRKKATQTRRDNQRARLLAAGDFSQTNLPQMDGASAGYPFSTGNSTARGDASSGAIDLPHPRPAFATTTSATPSRGWPYGGSLESLGSNLRSTPFIWPLGIGSNAGSPVESRGTPRTPARERDPPGCAYAMGVMAADGTSGARDVPATGTTTARPALGYKNTGGSGVLRRLRSVRYGVGGSNFNFGFPFGGGGGGAYRSLGEGDEHEEATTPSSGPPNMTDAMAATANTTTTNNNSGSGLGRMTTQSNDSNGSSVMHKSPLPPSYAAQHTSQNIHGSNGSRFSSQVGVAAGANVNANARGAPDAVPLVSATDTHDPLSRPFIAPLGPRPAPGASGWDAVSGLGGLRPSLGREDTGGSVWEVPPTYASLRRQGGRQE